MNNIAGLYNDYKKNFAKAEEFYLEAIHNENVFALNNIGSLYRNEKHDYIKAEAHYLKAITKKLFLAIVNLFSLYWYNMSKPEKSLFLCKQVFENEEWFRNESKGIVQLIMNLLLKQQYHFLLTEYQKENSLLQKYMQPIYYVVAWYLKDEMPGEYEKAGSEIKETVDEIIKTVNEMPKAEKDLLQETVS